MATRAALGRFFTAGEREAQPGSGSGWASAAARRMFWVGLLLRLLYMTLAHTYRFRAADDHFQFGWEMGRIARSLATGHGYANPFNGQSGPTAWTPPLYPLIMAGAFRVFGVYSNASGWVVLAVNSLCSAATAPAVYEIATRCYGRLRRPDGHSIALWSGWLWALYPAAMQYAVRWPWDMAVTVFFFTWAVVLALRLRGVGGASESERWPTWALFGLLWGLVALANSSLLTFLPVEVAWVLWPFRRRLLPVFGRGLIAAVVFLACVAPWVVRNAQVFHAFIPMRDNFGAELYMTALSSHDGFPYGTVLPLFTGDPEFVRYERMGELAYCRAQGVRARQIIAGERGQFARWVLFRVQFYWAGVPHPYDHGVADEVVRELNFAFLSVSGLLGLLLALRRRVPGTPLFAGAFLVVPLLYYAITVQARFRAPLEPMIAILTVYLFQSADRTRVWSRSPARATGHPAERELQR